MSSLGWERSSSQESDIVVQPRSAFLHHPQPVTIESIGQDADILQLIISASTNYKMPKIKRLLEGETTDSASVGITAHQLHCKAARRALGLEAVVLLPDEPVSEFESSGTTSHASN